MIKLRDEGVARFFPARSRECSVPPLARVRGRPGSSSRGCPLSTVRVRCAGRQSSALLPSRRPKRTRERTLLGLDDVMRHPYHAQAPGQTEGDLPSGQGSVPEHHAASLLSLKISPSACVWSCSLKYCISQVSVGGTNTADCPPRRTRFTVWPRFVGLGPSSSLSSGEVDEHQQQLVFTCTNADGCGWCAPKSAAFGTCMSHRSALTVSPRRVTSARVSAPTWVLLGVCSCSYCTISRCCRKMSHISTQLPIAKELGVSNGQFGDQTSVWKHTYVTPGTKLSLNWW